MADRPDHPAAADRAAARRGVPHFPRLPGKNSAHEPRQLLNVDRSAKDGPLVAHESAAASGHALGGLLRKYASWNGNLSLQRTH